MTLALLLLHLAAFVLGSIPLGYILGRIKGVDIRHEGSGNVGATNVGRLLGKKAGIVTLLGDIAKGVLGVSLVYFPPAIQIIQTNAEIFAATSGLCSVLGHCFSPFLHFHGGKGVATSLGVFAVLAPWETAAAVLVFLLIFKIFGYVSLGSLCAAVVLPLLVGLRAAYGQTLPMVFIVTLLISAVVIIRHRTNISRLRAGTEKKFACAKISLDSASSS